MRLLTASLVHKEVGCRFAFAWTPFKNLLIFASASRALGIKTLASGGKIEGELASLNPTTQGDGDSAQEWVSSSTNTSRNYVQQKLSLRSRGDQHRFTEQQHIAGRHELVSAKTMDSLLALAKGRKWQALVMILTGSPAKQNVGTMSNCFVWLGRNGKQKASLELFELLKKANRRKYFHNISKFSYHPLQLLMGQSRP